MTFIERAVCGVGLCRRCNVQILFSAADGQANCLMECTMSMG